jgi:hypothetical protein
MRGGDKIDDIQSQLDSIKLQLDELRNKSSDVKSDNDSIMEEEKFMTNESLSLPEEPTVIKSWASDKNLKFKDGAGGRVSLSFPRIMTLIDNNISKGNTTKSWPLIKSELNDANSVDDVQNVINKYKVSFASNYVAGTKKRRKSSKNKKTSRRH